MTLKDKAESIRQVIDRPVPTEDLEGLLRKLNDLTNISGLSAEIVPQARLQYREAQEKVIREYMETEINLPVSTMNDLIKARTAKEESLLEYCQLLDKRVSYTQESIRTIISLRKQEMNSGI